MCVDTFQLDSATGILRVATQGNLDRETTSSYTLTIQAANDQATGGTPATVSSYIA